MSFYREPGRRPQAYNAHTAPRHDQVDSRPRSPSKYPQKWNLYQPSWKRKFRIGEHQDAPLFTIVPHTGWFGRPRLTLHAGPDAKSDVAALVTKPSFPHDNRHGFEVRFPPTSSTAGSTADAASDSSGGSAAGGVVVEVRSNHPMHSPLQHRTYQFTIKLGRGWQRWTETFEWRHTHGDVPRVLRDGKDDGRIRKVMNRLEGGWQLVRQGSGIGRSGEGEVVAVWGEVLVSAHKKATFAFVNSGATGELGERFAETAVVSGMALWDEEQRERRQRQGNAGAGA